MMSRTLLKIYVAGVIMAITGVFIWQDWPAGLLAIGLFLMHEAS